MQFTKTAEELAERRAKVSKWIKSGQVETNATRTAKRKEQKRFEELEHKAELILSGLRGPTSRQNRGVAVSTPNPISSVPAAATTYLSEGDKYDELAVQADKVLQDIFNS